PEPEVPPAPEPGPAPEVPSPAPATPQPGTPTAVQAGRVTVARAVEKKAQAAPAEPPPAPRQSWYQRLRSGLSRSSRELADSISGVFVKRRLDDETLQDLEDVLIRADLGMETAIRVTDALAAGRYGKD